MSSQKVHAELPDWKLERYTLEELPPEEMARIRELIERDPTQRARLDALRRSSDEILAEYPAVRMARQIERRARENETSRAGEPVAQRAWWSAGWVPAVAVAMMVVAVLPLLRDRAEIGENGLPPGIRLKGSEAHLLLHRKTADGSELLKPDDTARAGDLIQVQYQAAGQAYGVILSIDGRGTVTQHFPSVGERNARLEQGSVILDLAYELDDAPGWEHFYFITSQTLFDVDDVVKAARDSAARPHLEAMGRARADSLVLPAGIEQSIFPLVKAPLSEEQAP